LPDRPPQGDKNGYLRVSSRTCPRRWDSNRFHRSSGRYPLPRSQRRTPFRALDLRSSRPHRLPSERWGARGRWCPRSPPPPPPLRLRAAWFRDPPRSRPSGVEKRPAESLVLEALVDQPALHPGAFAACCFGHRLAPFVCVGWDRLVCLGRRRSYTSKLGARVASARWPSLGRTCRGLREPRPTKKDKTKGRQEARGPRPIGLAAPPCRRRSPSS
jgi:hypothetical protein